MNYDCLLEPRTALTSEASHLIHMSLSSPRSASVRLLAHDMLLVTAVMSGEKDCPPAPIDTTRKVYTVSCGREGVSKEFEQDTVYTFRVVSIGTRGGQQSKEFEHTTGVRVDDSKEFAQTTGGGRLGTSTR